MATLGAQQSNLHPHKFLCVDDFRDCSETEKKSNHRTKIASGRKFVEMCLYIIIMMISYYA